MKIDLEKLKELNTSGYTQKQMAALLDVSRSTIQRALQALNLHTPNYHNLIKFNQNIFDLIDTEEKAYWLGFLYADGAISKNSNTIEISLKSADIEHLKKFKKFLQTPADIKISKVKIKEKEYERCRIMVTSKHLKEHLIKLGCPPQKSLILTFPNDLQVPKNLIKHFIRGYVDGDGSINYTRNGRFQVSITGTKEFLSGIQKIYSNTFPSIYKKKGCIHNTYYISTTANKADIFLLDIYKDSNIYLDRKYNRFAVLLGN